MSTAAAAHHPSAPQEVDVFTMMEEQNANDFHSNMPSNTHCTHEDEGDDDDDDDTMMMQAFLEEACDGEDCVEDPASFVMVDDALSVATEQQQQQQFLAATAAASTFRQVSDSTHGTHPTTASVTGVASTIGTNAAADSNAEEDMDDTMDTGNNNNLTTWETPMMEAAVSPSPPPSAGIHHPTAAAEEQAAAPFSSLSVTGRPPIPLYLSCNPDHLSPYQCAIRKQVELFEATSFDLQARIKGRNKPIVLGQVGIRCTHCRGIAPQDRDRGSMYYPHALVGIYQAAQILSQQHLLEACQQVPPAVRAELADLKSQKSPATAGKEYWAATAKVLGVYEDAHGLRFERRLGYARGLVEPH